VASAGKRPSAETRGAGTSIIAQPAHGVALSGEPVAIGLSVGLSVHPTRPFLAELVLSYPPLRVVGDPEKLVLVMRRSGCPGLTEAHVPPIGEPGGDEN
jgi:hypothetical protein